MKILIGTTNKFKIEGARQAFEEYFENVEIDGIKVNSDVDDEPINEQILQGAKNRIKNLKEYARENDIKVDYFIATEGGLSNSFGSWINVNISAIENSKGQMSIGISQAPQVPDKYIKEIRSSEMKNLKNRIFDSEEQKKQDLDSILTHGKFSRVDLVRDSFIMALVGQINGEIWRDNMNLLFKITDKDFGIIPQEMKDEYTRLAARGIVIREDGKIAVQNKSNKNEYKLIGGGIEEDEDPNIAFQREALEETGCEIQILEYLGITKEYRSKKNLKQISHIFIAKVIKDIHHLNLTQQETDEGARLLWVEPEEALKLVTDCYDKLLPSSYKDVYDTRFTVLRDRKILEYYLNNF